MSVQCPDGEHSMVWPKGSMSYLICERCDFTFGEVPPVTDSAHSDVEALRAVHECAEYALGYDVAGWEGHLPPYQVRDKMDTALARLDAEWNALLARLERQQTILLRHQTCEGEKLRLEARLEQVEQERDEWQHGAFKFDEERRTAEAHVQELEAALRNIERNAHANGLFTIRNIARRALAPDRPTHGRHCPCSACSREDWTKITAPCGIHGSECPAVYAPWIAPPDTAEER